MIIIQPDQTLKKFDEKDSPIEVTDSLIRYLDDYVELDEDLTLEDIFKFIKREREDFAKLFLCQLGGFDLELYLKEIDRPVQEHSFDDVKIEYLEVYWSSTHEEINGEKYFDTYCGFHGKGLSKDPLDKDKWIETGIAVEFTPLDELKQYPLKLNEEIKIYGSVDISESNKLNRIERTLRQQNKTKKADKVTKRKKELKKIRETIIVDSYKHFTVYEFIGEILSEISFCGTPLNRSVMLADIDQKEAEVKSILKDSNNIEKLKPFGDLLDEMDKMDPLTDEDLERYS
jgi:hypothetical protein